MKLGKFSTESEKCFGYRGKSETEGKCIIASEGMDASGTSKLKYSVGEEIYCPIPGIILQASNHVENLLSFCSRSFFAFRVLRVYGLPDAALNKSPMPPLSFG